MFQLIKKKHKNKAFPFGKAMCAGEEIQLIQLFS